MYNTIGIIGAMPDEVKILNGKLSGAKSETVAGVTFTTGELHGKTVTVCCAGMGKVNAACATQLLITKYNAQCILFSGIAGNMTSKISVGDLVISDVVCYHDAELPMIAQSYPGSDCYKADVSMIAAAQKACDKHGINHIVGKIATGDLFIADSAVKNAIAAKCNPDCVEMEGAAVGHIAAKNDVPFLIIRAMSDDCDEGARDKLVVKQFDITEYVHTATLITEETVAQL
ncbi:MAG: 5'-methylthioadenosine/adenosylhomocysteine nucleosidase [Oscillospiraceae bacterium]|nr:5'-methylthioadenosine/adenosylhomocysteine nucleosidase [Oscillospiraceae bacterium]